MQTVSLVQEKPPPAPLMERKELLLQQLFEEQADRRPDAVALITDTNEISYRELEECANQLARYLQAQGVQAGDLVGLYCSRSESSIIAILGILKTGAGYVPIDDIFRIIPTLSALPDGATTGVIETALIDFRKTLA